MCQGALQGRSKLIPVPLRSQKFEHDEHVQLYTSCAGFERAELHSSSVVRRWRVITYRTEGSITLAAGVRGIK
jgi:hypothetical protein